MRQNNQVSYQQIQLPFKIKKAVLALGSQTKNTLCFAKGNSACLSRLRPDLDNPRDFSEFEREVKYFLKKNPRIIAYDLHPEYQSTKYIQSLSPRHHVTTSPIQHHHAHIASCMAENGLVNQKVIGAAFDGTGLGSDNRLWGAEFFICDYKDFIRAAHLKEIPLLGGQRAIQEPWRLAAVWLYRLYKDKFLNLGIKFTQGIDRKEWRVLRQMYLADFNSPPASSMGRLFDAAASLILAKHKAGFEAELAIALQKLVTSHKPPFDYAQGRQVTSHKSEAGGYNFKIIKKRNGCVIDPLPMFREIVADLKAGAPKAEIAYRFHAAVARMLARTCAILRKKYKISTVVLSGGVFQNNLLLRLSLDLLYKEDFQVVAHKNLSSNDSGISLGQAVIAGIRGNLCV